MSRRRDKTVHRGSAPVYPIPFYQPGENPEQGHLDHPFILGSNRGAVGVEMEKGYPDTFNPGKQMFPRALSCGAKGKP